MYPTLIGTLFRIYIIGLLMGSGCILISLVIDRPSYEEFSSNYPLNFFVALGIGPFIVGAIFLFSYVKETQHRTNDRYRFSRRQVRRFSVNLDRQIDFNFVASKLEKLNYQLLEKIQREREFLVRALRKEFSSQYFRSPFIPQVIEILGSFRDQALILTIVGESSRWLALDFRSITYNCLEEVTDTLSIREFQVDEMGRPEIYQPTLLPK